MADANLNIILKVVNEATKELTKVVKALEQLGGAAGETAKNTKQTADSMGLLQNGLGKIVNGVKLLAGGWVGLKALQMPVHLAEAAGEAEALAIGLNAVGKAAGYTEDQLKGAVEEIEKLGITSTAAQKNLNRLITSNVSLEAGVALAESAKRVANALGRSTEEVFQTMAFSVSQGTTRLLRRQFGIVLNEQLVFQRRAQELGRELFQDEKRQAISDAINALTKSKFAAAESSDTLSAKQDQLRVATDRLSENTGKFLLPAYKSAIEQSNIFITRLDLIIQKMLEAKKHGGSLFSQIGAGIDEALNPSEPVLTQQLDTARKALADLEARKKRLDQSLLGKLPFVSFDNEIKAELQKIERLQKALAEKKAKADTDAEVARLRLRTGLDLSPDQAGGTPEENPDRLEEERRRGQDRAKARADGAVKGAQAILTATKLTNQAVEAEDKSSLERGLLSHEEYFARRRKRIEEEADAEIKVAKAQAAAAAQALSERTAEIFKPGVTKGTLAEAIASDAKAITAQQNLAAAREVVRNKEAEKGLKIQENTNALLGKQEDLERKILDLQLDTGVKQNENDKAAAVGQILLKYNDILRTQGLINEEDGKAIDNARSRAIIAAQNLEIAEKLFAIETKRIDLQRTRENALVDSERKRIQLAEKSGAIGGNEAQERQNALIRTQIALNEQRLAQDEARLAEMKEQGTVSQQTIDTLEDKIRGLKLATDDLRLSVVSLGETLKREFEGSFANFIDTLIQRTATFKEALRKFALDVLGSVSKQISNQLAQDITSGLVKAGGGDNGIFGVIGRLISGAPSAAGGASAANASAAAIAAAAKPDGSSPAKALHVIPHGPQGVPIDGGVPELSEEELADQQMAEFFQDEVPEVFDEAAEGIEEVVTQNSETFLSGLNGMFDFLLTSLLSLFTSQAAAESTSSLVGSFGAAFGGGTATAADGGKIVGPSHARGGVMINAEGGEYVINKRATRRWGPLLDSINFGGGAPSLRARGVYADGGMVAEGVGATNSNTEINISIHDSEAKTSGNNEGAVQFAKLAGRMVQEELIKQKRPGGMLYNQK